MPRRSGRPKKKARLPAWFASLSKGVKALVAAVIAAGAVATSLGAILALWPDGPSPIAELRAELTELTVDENVTLGEYTVRRQDMDGSSAPGGSSSRRLSDFSAAQPTPTDASTHETETETTATDTTETETTETETTATETGVTDTTETETTETETTAPDDDGGGDDIIVTPTLSSEAESRLAEAVRAGLTGPSLLPRPHVDEACVTGLHKPACGLSSTVLFINVAEDSDPAEVVERLNDVLRDTRSEKQEPIGVTVGYRISLTGFRRRKVDVRWELHRPGGPPLPYAWLKSQRAGLLQGEAERDSASPEFWIPLPKEPGPFFVRLTALNEHGVTLARAETSSFAARR